MSWCEKDELEEGSETQLDRAVSLGPWSREVFLNQWVCRFIRQPHCLLPSFLQLISIIYIYRKKM